MVIAIVIVHAYLSLLALIKQNSLDWVIYKQQKFIAQGLGGWEVQAPVELASGEVLFLTEDTFCMLSHGRRYDWGPSTQSYTYTSWKQSVPDPVPSQKLHLLQ